MEGHIAETMTGPRTRKDITAHIRDCLSFMKNFDSQAAECHPMCLIRFHVCRWPSPRVGLEIDLVPPSFNNLVSSTSSQNQELESESAGYTRHRAKLLDEFGNILPR